jgi:hypothetical protein
MEIITTTSSVQLHYSPSEQHIIIYCLTTLYHILPIQLRESIHILQTIWISDVYSRIAIFHLGVDLDDVLVKLWVIRGREVDIWIEEVTGKNKLRLSIGKETRLRGLGGHVGECQFESADWCT